MGLRACWVKRAGAVAVTMEDNADQPVLEPNLGETPLWGQTRLTGLYAADVDMDDVLQAFPTRLLQQASQRVEILEDKDWEREWMRHYRPLQFGKRLWVCPSWLQPPDPDAVNLLLDPGLAFGTGTHPTTALCLRELDGMAYHQIADVLDLSLGTVESRLFRARGRLRSLLAKDPALSGQRGASNSTAPGRKGNE